MKPVDTTQITRTAPVRADLAKTASGTSRQQAGPAPQAAEPAMVARSGASQAGDKPPVDQERVREIRNALRDGTYPLTPATVADAMIAAGYMLTEMKKD